MNGDQLMERAPVTQPAAERPATGRSNRGRPAAAREASRSSTPPPTSYRSPSASRHTSTRSSGDLPASKATRAEARGSALDGDPGDTRSPMGSSSQYTVASSISMIIGRARRARSERARATSEDAGRMGTSDQPTARTGSSTARVPIPDRATKASSRPDPTLPRVPLAPCQSRTSNRAGMPRSSSERTAGQASYVDGNRPTTLLEGISRSEYPTAPMTRMSSPSPGLGAYRPSSPVLQSYSTSSGSASFVCTSIALRGAPCGDDPRAWPAFGGYHHPEPAEIRPADGSVPLLELRVLQVGERACQGAHHHGLCLEERNAALPDIDPLLLRVTVIEFHPRHGSQRRLPADCADKRETSHAA